MKSAYSFDAVYNLFLLKESKRWFKHGLMDPQQHDRIKEIYKTPFYHPNFVIRIVLFVATALALSGVTGVFFLVFADVGEKALYIAAILYGIGSFYALEKLFIRNNHYKSGVTEAVMYHACGFTIGGFFDMGTVVILVVCCVVFTFTAIRYLDLMTTLAAMGSLAGLLFYQFYQWGGIFQQIIPFLFIVSFTVIYFLTKYVARKTSLRLWRNNLLVIESVSLLLVYLAGNYLVVRELSIALMGVVLTPGQDIPFAFLFYGFTVIIPVLYLYFGIKNKDIVLLRVSLIVVAASVFTFKYYYNFGHPEITLTIAGAIVLLVSIAVLNYLKTMRNGFTRELLLTEKWGAANLEAFVVSQTMGGNTIKTDSGFKGGGGTFGGGGASGDF